MILIVGLGNLGTAFEQTPHNLGFRCVEMLAAQSAAQDFVKENRFMASVTTVRSGREKRIFAKPQTMMNRSGDAVRLLTRFFRIRPAAVWVIHDDLDLPPGTFRHSYDSRAAGHRGVQSIIDALGSQSFHRIRIGVGRHEQYPPEIFVLRPMTKTLTQKTQEALQEILQVLPSLLNESSPSHGVEKGARHHQPPRRSLGK